MLNFLFINFLLTLSKMSAKIVKNKELEQNDNYSIKLEQPPEEIIILNEFQIFENTENKICEYIFDTNDCFNKYEDLH